MEIITKELIEEFGGFAMEKQLFFADMAGEMGWNVDLQEGEITFADGLFFPIQMLGTFSHSSETWLWAWANAESGIPANLLKQAKMLKKYGKTHKIDFLTKDKFEVERNDLHSIGLIAVGLCEASGYYLGNYGAGTMCLTINPEDFEKFPNDHISIFTSFPKLISQFEINHKAALVNYLTQKNYTVEAKDNEIIGFSEKGKVKASFDNLCRLIELKDITE